MCTQLFGCQTRVHICLQDLGRPPCSNRIPVALARTGQTSFIRRLRSGYMGNSGTVGIHIHDTAFSGMRPCIAAAARAAVATAAAQLHCLPARM